MTIFLRYSVSDKIPLLLGTVLPLCIGFPFVQNGHNLSCSQGYFFKIDLVPALKPSFPVMKN